MRTFKQYIKYREFADDKFGLDPGGDNLDKLNDFVLLAVANQDIRSSLYPILQQIAGQDDTGELQDLLKQIDFNSLGPQAKRMLKQKKDSDEGDDGKDKDDQVDMVKASQADSGVSGLEET